MHLYTDVVLSQSPLENSSDVSAILEMIKLAPVSPATEMKGNIESKPKELSCSNSSDGFIGVDRKRQKYKKFFLSGIVHSVLECTN
jgi:hypothetical protein